MAEEAVGEEWLSQLRHYATHVLTVEGSGRDITVSGTYRLKPGKVETAVRIATRTPPAFPCCCEVIRGALFFVPRCTCVPFRASRLLVIHLSNHMMNRLHDTFLTAPQPSPSFIATSPDVVGRLPSRL